MDAIHYNGRDEDGRSNWTSTRQPTETKRKAPVKRLLPLLALALLMCLTAISYSATRSSDAQAEKVWKVFNAPGPFTGAGCDSTEEAAQKSAMHPAKRALANLCSESGYTLDRNSVEVSGGDCRTCSGGGYKCTINALSGRASDYQ